MRFFTALRSVQNDSMVFLYPAVMGRCTNFAGYNLPAQVQPGMRKSDVFILITCINLVLLLGLAVHARLGERSGAASLAVSAGLVQEFRLTDLCLFTEARYTRHPSMADFHAPFQDHPGALDHFPSGSLVSPPRFFREGL